MTKMGQIPVIRKLTQYVILNGVYVCMVTGILSSPCPAVIVLGVKHHWFRCHCSSWSLQAKYATSWCFMGLVFVLSFFFSLFLLLLLFVFSVCVKELRNVIVFLSIYWISGCINFKNAYLLWSFKGDIFFISWCNLRFIYSSLSLIIIFLISSNPKTYVIYIRLHHMYTYIYKLRQCNYPYNMI